MMQYVSIMVYYKKGGFPKYRIKKKRQDFMNLDRQYERTMIILQYYSLTTQGKSRIRKSLTMIRTRFLRMAVYAVTQETCGRFTRLKI